MPEPDEAAEDWCADLAEDFHDAGMLNDEDTSELFFTDPPKLRRKE